ncbi:hypothetical protein SGLAU_33255 (plasmid) [Streptomyces glaucescens]|uniref:Uncharacterized protein n=1 Tax=Streptomyces glaucescens TaxID=1907 RepID=A0A089XH14_STRGA|nr:hypothetical protein SGLAU_33255 [Streptomyces glaucescens]
MTDPHAAGTGPSNGDRRELPPSKPGATPLRKKTLVKGAAEDDPTKHITPMGLGVHLDDAVACGLLATGSSPYDLHVTDAGLAF